ncbi:MAG: CRISPR-associated protein Cas4 [Armatimonadetes bacterium]|nr:CRISPR-associated protein Cas4 [Armatimonadota bacterium]
MSSVPAEDEAVVMVSAVAHYAYCPRRCGLIYVENLFDDNVFTLLGSAAHVRADQPTETTKHGVIIEHALPIWSDKHGLCGRADVVEFHPDGSILPVEYKISPKHRIEHARFQLCAQAICLEEMFGRAVTSGAAYSSSSHQRVSVAFTTELREETARIIELIRKMLVEQNLPPPVNDRRCPNCSLVHLCVPEGISNLASVHCEDFLFLPSDREVAE